jgi:hypothetical protein
VENNEILTQISELVTREHELRALIQSGDVTANEEQEQLDQLEGALDQCWDLLRQRRAKREFGQDVDAASARSVDQVEHYLQ